MAKKTQAEKAKQIQIEQRKQMEDKIRRERAILEADRKHFNEFGSSAYAKFYKNEDMRKSAERNLKGGANVQAKAIRDEYTRAQRDMRDKMKKEAEDRKNMMQLLKNEEVLAKQKQIEEKKKLRAIQEEDKKQKQETRNKQL